MSGKFEIVRDKSYEEDIDDMTEKEIRAPESRCRRAAKKSGRQVLKRGDRYWLAPIPWVNEADLSEPMPLHRLYGRFFNEGRVERLGLADCQWPS